ncbi:hypothetical protein [Clostridium aminobutyricum]|uniref:Uncharacterized protein n=1 Tax=Clostridium aminobutyricum TaxID=33953 RepID=A0A939D927_CLOAM|nr:hypothetical protein [Clostridium aminobutyricum]MBN7773659.1 hypothetical protein [Clostridium aminobutyricum]
MENKVDNVDLRTSNGEMFPEGLIETSEFKNSEDHNTMIDEANPVKQAILRGHIPGEYNEQYVRGTTSSEK